MDLRRSWDDMRTRTAFVLFFTALLIGGMVTFAVGAGAATKTMTPGNKLVDPKASTESAEIVWREFGAGLQEAKTAKRPVVVDVYTSWCGWCKRMERDTFTNADVRRLLGESFVPVKMNAESNGRAQYQGDEYSHRQLASGFRVTGYPTTLFFDAEGTHILSAPGYMNARDYLTVLRYVAEGAYKTTPFDAFKKAMTATSEAR